MKFHPLSECLPILPGHELDELAQDIKEHGLKDPITLFEGKILDGRNRYLACKRAGVKPKFQDLEGTEDPLAFVISMNMARRHLTPSQKAMAVAKLAVATTGWKPAAGRPGKKKIGSQDPISIPKAAEAAGVSPATAKRAKEVLEQSPEKAEQVVAGEKTVKRAAQEIKEEKAAEVVAVDALGYPVPEPALPYWNRSQEVKDMLKQISKLKSWAEELQKRKDPLYSEVNMNELRVDFGNIYQAIKGALPYVVCTSCQGQLPDTCTLCKGRGVISEFRWNHALPEEVRAMRSKAVINLQEARRARGTDQTNEPEVK